MNLTELVGSVLEERRPGNVDPAGPIRTGEGPEVEIVIVPHRDLDGISLVAWTDQKGARLMWAHVGDLSTHDDLDLGVVVENIPCAKHWARSWAGLSCCEGDGDCSARISSTAGS